MVRKQTEAQNLSNKKQIDDEIFAKIKDFPYTLISIAKKYNVNIDIRHNGFSWTLYYPSRRLRSGKEF